MDPIKYFAIEHECASCGLSFAVVRFDSNSGLSTVYNKDSSEFVALPANAKFDPVALTYEEGFASEEKSELEALLKKMKFGKKYTVRPISADEWEWILYETPKGWYPDEFGDWKNDHYQVGAEIRLNCYTGEWDLKDSVRTESYISKLAAFRVWENRIARTFPFFEIR